MFMHTVTGFNMNIRFYNKKVNTQRGVAKLQVYNNSTITQYHWKTYKVTFLDPLTG